MTDLIFSKQIKDRQKNFPWLKIFQRKLLKNFPDNLDFDNLEFLFQNIEEEVSSLPKSGKTKRKEALFEVVYGLFLHFWWSIGWKGKKKWSRRWKNVSSDIPYTKDEGSKCCEKLLYYIIHLGITLSDGSSDSEWIGKVIQAIHVLPSFDSMIYNSLFQINNLSNKYHSTYIAILKHVLCTEVAVSITDPVVYIKTMFLFRKLRKFSNDEFTISDLEATALSIKPPSDIIQWMSSHAIDFPSEKYENVGKELLNKKSKNLFRKLCHVITTPVDSKKKKINIQPCPSEGVESLNCKVKVKKCKLTNNSHSELKMRDSELNPSVHSEMSTSLNCKLQANTTITKKSKKYKKFKKKMCPKSQNLLDKKLNKSARMIGANAMNEFLNFSFAEISNFSKRAIAQKQNILHLSEGNNGIESISVTKATVPNDTTAIKNFISNCNEEGEQVASCNDPSSLKKIKLDTFEKTYNQNQSIQKCNVQDTGKTTCSNSLVTLSSNMLKNLPLNTSEILTNVCTNNTTSKHDQVAGFSRIPVPGYRCSLNNNLLGTKTSANQTSQIQTKQTSPDKIPFVSSVDIQKIHPSALLKLVQLPNEDLTSRNCKTSSGSVHENINSNQIHENADNPSIALPPPDKPSSILRAPQSLKVLCEVPQNVFPENNTTTQIDTDKAVVVADGIGDMHVSKKANENICKNSEMNLPPSPENSSVDLCNNLNHRTSWVEKESNSSPFPKGLFDDNRWGESQPLIPTINRSLDPTQNCLANHTKSSFVNSEVPYVNSVTPITENRYGNVTVSQIDTSPTCVVDCKIVGDYEPNNMQSFKVVINVSCKTPEDTPNQQSEHIFGHFNNASENYFDSSQNLFATANPTPDMPKLTPFYDDPPISTAAVDSIATPPDSELEASIPTSSKLSETETLTNSFFEKPQTKPNCSSTPNITQNTLHRRTSKEDSDFRTPQTSDCESEYNVENVFTKSPVSRTSAMKSPVTRTSAMKSPVDDILERLNYKINLPQHKSESYYSTTAQNASKGKVSFRNFTDIFSYDELSEDSTVSNLSCLSATDNELNNSTAGQEASTLKYCAKNKSLLTDASNLKASDIDAQKSLNNFKNKRKNPHPKKYSESDQNSAKNIQKESSSNITCGYNLRPRKKLNRPSSLDDFF